MSGFLSILIRAFKPAAMEQRRTRRNQRCLTLPRISLVTSLIVLLLGCQPLREDPSLTATAFARALLHNDAEQAKALVTDSHHERIDAWVRSHTKFDCPSGEDSSVVASRLRETPEQWSYTVELPCFDEGFEHCFKVSGILLERTDNAWTVLDWTVSCDAPDSFCEACR